jgi:hypothetical protein
MYSYLAGESACCVAGEDDMHAVPQKGEQVARTLPRLDSNLRAQAARHL